MTDPAQLIDIIYLATILALVCVVAWLLHTE